MQQRTNERTNELLLLLPSRARSLDWETKSDFMGMACSNKQTRNEKRADDDDGDDDDGERMRGR